MKGHSYYFDSQKEKFSNVIEYWLNASSEVKKIVNLPRKAQICMVISAGKRDEKGVYGKRIRFDNSIFIKVV